jgi:acyl transferase domain-containing protein
MLSPVTMSRICQLGALSPAGRCRTLDASADGYGRSEGCVAFVIAAADAATPVGGGGGGGGGGSDAAAGGGGFQSAVYIAGSAVNQDGRSSSLTTPNGASQQSLVRAAAFQAQAETLGCLMLHGTATPLGDPIEIAAVAAVFGARVFRVFASAMHLAAPKSVIVGRCRFTPGWTEPGLTALGFSA